MRSYVSINDTDDMQTDTYGIVARYVEAISISITEKNPEQLESLLTSIYLIIHSRLPEAKVIEDRLNVQRNALYGDASVDAGDMSRIFDELISIWKTITQALDDAGILFRIKVDPNTLITK